MMNERVGESNTPKDERNEGVVTIEDRVKPGGSGSPGSNQGKAEPFSTGEESVAASSGEPADSGVAQRSPGGRSISVPGKADGEVDTSS